MLHHEYAPVFGSMRYPGRKEGLIMEEFKEATGEYLAVKFFD
jgi:hypothetical protein